MIFLHSQANKLPAMLFPFKRVLVSCVCSWIMMISMLNSSLTAPDCRLTVHRKCSSKWTSRCRSSNGRPSVTSLSQVGVPRDNIACFWSCFLICHLCSLCCYCCQVKRDQSRCTWLRMSSNGGNAQVQTIDLTEFITKWLTSWKILSLLPSWIARFWRLYADECLSCTLQLVS